LATLQRGHLLAPLPVHPTQEMVSFIRQQVSTEPVDQGHPQEVLDCPKQRAADDLLSGQLLNGLTIEEEEVRNARRHKPFHKLLPLVRIEVIKRATCTCSPTPSGVSAHWRRMQ
jgi:hypothetical protein